MVAHKTELGFHRLAASLFSQGKFEDAAQLLAEAIAEAPTAELWNDWAATQVHLGRFGEAELAFRRSLILDPASAETAANFGALLSVWASNARRLRS
jgi:Flp pilus assembly protein TadD